MIPYRVRGWGEQGTESGKLGFFSNQIPLTWNQDAPESHCVSDVRCAWRSHHWSYLYNDSHPTFIFHGCRDDTPQTGRLDNRTLFVPCSRGWKSEIKTLARVARPHTSLLGGQMLLQLVPHMVFPLKVNVWGLFCPDFLFLHKTRQTAWGPTLDASF